MPDIIAVTEPSDVDLVEMLAKETWTQHYVPIIGQAQVDYMLDKFQSAPAITSQISDGYEYYLVRENGRAAGYFAIVPARRDGQAQLSKLYVRHGMRGGGIGRSIMRFVEKRCHEIGAKEVWLTVNKHNEDSIAFYLRVGFTNAGSIVQDIGNGFVMDDFRMVKKLSE